MAALAGSSVSRAGGTADLDKDLALLFNVPIRAARRRASLIQLEGAVAGRWGAEGRLGVHPGQERGDTREIGRAFLRKENLGAEERMGHAVGQHSVYLYCLPSCFFPLQLYLFHCKNTFLFLSLLPSSTNELFQ